jgi:hypothetical protein
LYELRPFLLIIQLPATRRVFCSNCVAREAIFYTIYFEPGFSPQGFGILRLNLIGDNRDRFHQHLTQLLDRADPKNEKKDTDDFLCFWDLLS